MKLLAFGMLTAVFTIIAYFIFALIVLQCGMGPDSPAECNAGADRQGVLFAFGALILYVFGSLLFWGWRPLGKREE